jgi:hypothetical protein
MKKVFKAIFFAGGVAAAGYLGFRTYRIIKEMNRLEHDLPGHLEQICGELPKVRGIIMMAGLIMLTLKITLSAEALAKFEDLNETVLDYVRENHPKLLKYKLKVKVSELAPEDEEAFHSGAEFTDPEEG